MNEEIRELLLISLKAQYSYISNRLINGNFNFSIDVNYIFNCI